jgi:hypothetical protein
MNPADDSDRPPGRAEKSAMTYNFDPDRWLDNELDALEIEYKAGRLDETEYERLKDKLLERYDDMVARLDGTYRIPKQ